MSREFIDAIESGDNLEAGDEFNNSISSKVGDVLESRRKEISQTFAGNDEVVEVKLDEIDADDVMKFVAPIPHYAIKGIKKLLKKKTDKGESPGVVSDKEKPSLPAVVST